MQRRSSIVSNLINYINQLINSNWQLVFEWPFLNKQWHMLIAKSFFSFSPHPSPCICKTPEICIEDFIRNNAVGGFL
jgi:hypothetical protein